ncbi:hypothetical protein JRO89_XS06G0163500 [Xanthoceras sorbifolium]|uniref:peroxidase n=1 Tax=Xanthoceras sorbifolium TaxID=99658 RepID=A0ABQ8HYM3_9ROSI|nr:hypothetical protein JRO89_XS06G0163500 [Xanthoceras sorbifolium]
MINLVMTTTNIHVQTWKPLSRNKCHMDATLPAAFRRLMFHDCQVQGCDASILLDSEGSEMVSSRNFGIRIRKIKQIKTVLEAERPGQEDPKFGFLSEEKIPGLVVTNKLTFIFLLQESLLYDPNSRYQINHSFELLLRLECPPTITPLTNITVVPNDGKPLVFDNHYYTEMLWPGRCCSALTPAFPDILGQRPPDCS